MIEDLEIQRMKFICELLYPEVALFIFGVFLSSPAFCYVYSTERLPWEILWSTRVQVENLSAVPLL